MDKNRPKGRKVFNSGGGTGVGKTGPGFNGKVGSGGFLGGGSGSSGGSGGSGSSGSSGNFSSQGQGQTSGNGSGGGFHFGGARSGGGKGGCLPILIVLAVLLFGGGGLAVNNLGDSEPTPQETIQSGGGNYNGWFTDNSSTGNTGELNTRVSSEARAKFTKIKGGGEDVATIMVYMCGTDLESRSAMGTSDLNEMISATVGKNVNLIVYTGGCKKWRNNQISSTRNQVWQISNGNIRCLIEDAGNDPMTKPATLTSFIKWADQKFPSNRTCLIFWDHGGGSISGYGYDEKYPQSGSMTLSGINTALKDAGLKYDFIGFDACLMATAETALVLSNYADYMIGSEETEPGIGWYYTNWLTDLSADTSLSTLEIGKRIADDFTKQCASRCPGQTTTLSVTDLSELSQTLPDKLNAFAEETGTKITEGDYREVATARSGSKEFARSTGIDQVDLIHFASRLDTGTSKELAKTLSEAIKYNVTSKGTANAYGLSIYFPYRSLHKVDSIANTYDQIGMDDDYTACIRKFAQMEVSGQAVSGGTSPFESLMGTGSGTPQLDTQAMQQLIGSLLGGGFSDFRSLGMPDLNEGNTEFLRTDPLNATETAEYISANRITSEDLVWKENKEGKQAIILTEEQWELIETADLNMYYDDGKGYIELGLDNIYDFDDDGNLLPNLERTWISINGQPVAYYHMETMENGEDYTITGYVPIVLGDRNARLILTFDQDNEQGYVAGVSYDYDDKVTETEAKNLTGLKAGDEIKFMCDYYGYDGKFSAHHQLGKTMKVTDPEKITITNTDVGTGKVSILYRFTDIYGQEYWTPAIKK